jgi:hypothetical protein
MRAAAVASTRRRCGHAFDAINEVKQRHSIANATAFDAMLD